MFSTWYGPALAETPMRIRLWISLQTKTALKFSTKMSKKEDQDRMLDKLSQGDWVTADGTWISPQRIWKARDFERGLNDYIEKTMIRYWEWFDAELAKYNGDMRKYRNERQAWDGLEQRMSYQPVVYPRRVDPFELSQPYRHRGRG